MIHTATIFMPVTIDINKLIKLVKYRKTSRRKLTNLTVLGKTRHSGFTLTRYKLTNVKYPLIIDTDNFVIDGRHRYWRLFDTGAKTAKVVVVSDAELLACKVKKR